MAETQTASVIEVRKSTDLEALGDLEGMLLGVKEVPEVADDPEEISREILMQLLAAESDEELVQQEAIGWRELKGVPIEISGFRWRPSEFDTDEEGNKQERSLYFIVFGFRCDTGESVTMTVGSKNVLAQLINMARRRTIPGAIWAYEQSATKTARGYTPSWLTVNADVLAAREAKSARATVTAEGETVKVSSK
jgi:hypothetical protein